MHKPLMDSSFGDRLELLFESQTVGIAFLDGRRLLDVNETFTRITGTDRNTLLTGFDPLAYLGIAEFTDGARFSSQLAPGGRFVSIEVRRFGDRWAIVVRDADKESAFAISEEHYRYLVESSPQMPWIASADGKIRQVSNRWLSLTGLSFEDATGDGWLIVPASEDIPALAHTWHECLRTGHTFDMEHRIRTADGSFRWCRTHAVARRNEQGDIVCWYGTTEDIHDRKLAEQALSERVQLLDLSDDAIFAWDQEHGIVFWNAGAQRLYGFTPEQAIGQIPHAILQTVHPCPKDEIMRELQSRGRWEGELRHTCLDGRVVTVLSRHQSLPGVDGSQRILETNRDITDRKVVEDRYRFMAESVPNPLWTAGPDGLLDYCNSAYEVYLGQTLDIPQDERIDYVHHPDDLEEAVRRWNDSVANGDDFEMTYRLRRADGAYRWNLCRARAMKDADGHVLKWFGVIVDIHDLRTAQDELRTSQERMRMAMAATDLGVWHRDLTTDVIDMSDESRRHFGLSRSDSMPTFLVLLGQVAEEDRERLRRECERSIQEHQVLDAMVRTIDGRVIRIMGVTAGGPRWCDGVTLDVTDHVQAEAELEQKVAERTAQLQAATQELEGFTYSVAHDLKAPLRAIAATSRILLDEASVALSKDHQELLVRQAYNARRLGTLMDDLLKLSRIGRHDLVRRPVDMTALALDVVHQLGDDQERFDVQQDMSATGDREMLRLTLENLIENAVKYSPDGGKIWVGCCGGVFYVADEGIGFEMDYADRIFQPFERLHREEFPGTGIGLANVKRIVERHNGRVWADAQPGRGATFFFMIS